MGKHDWYRRSTWSPADQADFFARFKRSRSPASKAQYLRIQAFHLAEAGLHAAAMQLLDQLFQEHPCDHELAEAHRQKAQCFIALQQDDEALAEFRKCLNAERLYPTVRSVGWLEFGWFVVSKNLTKLFDEVLAVFGEFTSDVAGSVTLLFPIERYRYATVCSLIAHARGQKEQARHFAQTALENAAAVHSGFRYHPNVGLVHDTDPEIHARLRAIIAA